MDVLLVSRLDKLISYIAKQIKKIFWPKRENKVLEISIRKNKCCLDFMSWQISWLPYKARFC